MCGIAGFVSERPLRRALLAEMITSLRHRGPDDEGIGLWDAGGPPDGTGATGRIGLAQRRLAVIDVSPLGHNPMPWDNGRLWITYNGEIYNFRELRRELEGLGDRFRSSTDTEVVLAAYDRWGEACVDRFVGMFAFGLWDASRRKLFLARDRFGKKPLYYAEYAGRFAFGSELKAVLADPEFPRTLDPDALSLYLRCGYAPAPYTAFTHARKLRPGHCATLQDGRLTVRQYWDPVAIALSGPLTLSAAEARERLETLLRDSVRQRMISDVPLGAFLSGGLDSSLVVALMQEESPVPVKTFTMGFENSRFDEAPHAAAVARHLRTEHRERTCSASQVLELVDRLGEFFDEPFADSSALPTYLLSKMAREDVTVVLTGDGGDELFFGYGRYEYVARASWLLRMPLTVRRAAGVLASAVPVPWVRSAAGILRQPEPDAYAGFVTWWNRGDVEALTGRPGLENPVYREAAARLAALPPAERPPALDTVTYLPEDILTKVDRASMATSLEARVPFLDHRVAEFALRLPLALKYRGGVTKHLLREILYTKVPRQLLDRPKKGFGVPLRDWFLGPLRERMEAVVAGPELIGLGLDPRHARAVWSDFLAKRSDRSSLLWSLFALASWSERWSSPHIASDSSRS